MRSEDYSSSEQSFLGPVGRAQKIRTALVEGLKPGDQQETYVKLAKKLRPLDSGSIDRCAQLFSKLRMPDEQVELEGILGKLSYRSDSWGDLDYDVLRAEGVVRDFKGKIGYLAELALRTPEHVVFSVDPGILDPDEDYKKHIRDASKLKLDSKEIIAAFAQRKGFELSGSFQKRGYLTRADKKVLEEHGFTFSAALREAVDFMHRHENKYACVLTFTRSNGDETRLFPYSVFVEAPEHFLYFRDHTYFKQNKDYALKQFSVPKRYPETDGGLTGLTDLVEMKYVPDFEHNLGLDWRDVEVSCDCEHAMNQRNFEMIRGAKKVSPNVVDEHVGSALLFYLQGKGFALSMPNSFVKFLLPEPMRAVDFLRYNVYGAYDEHGEELGIEPRENLLNNAIPELFKLLDFEAIFGEFRKDSNRYILRSMH